MSISQVKKLSCSIIPMQKIKIKRQQAEAYKRNTAAAKVSSFLYWSKYSQNMGYFVEFVPL